MSSVDFDVPTTLFIRKRNDAPGSGDMDSREFATTAEAIKYAMEELGDDVEEFYLSGITEQLSQEAVREAYMRDDFPLDRR